MGFHVRNVQSVSQWGTVNKQNGFIRKQGKSLEGHSHQFEFFCKGSTFHPHGWHRGTWGSLFVLFLRVCILYGKWVTCPLFTYLSRLAGLVEVSFCVADDGELLLWCLELRGNTRRPWWAWGWNPRDTVREKTHQPLSHYIGVRS